MSLINTDLTVTDGKIDETISNTEQLIMDLGVVPTSSENAEAIARYTR